MSHDPTMRPIGMVTTIFGLTLNPFVSSSKNRSRPALEAGSGAPFFFLLALTAGGRCGLVKSVLRAAALERGGLCGVGGRRGHRRPSQARPGRSEEGAGAPRSRVRRGARRGQSAAGWGRRIPAGRLGQSPLSIPLPRPASAGAVRTGTRRRPRCAAPACRRPQRGSPRPSRPPTPSPLPAVCPPRPRRRACGMATAEGRAY